MQAAENTSFRSEFWGVCCESGKKYSQVVQKKFHVTMAVLESPVKGTSDIVSLMVERGGMQYLICSLKPDTQLQVNLDLYFDKGEKVAFFIKGHGKIHLSGYHIYDKNDPESNFSEKSFSENMVSMKELKFNLMSTEDSDKGSPEEKENTENIVPKASTTSPKKAVVVPNKEKSKKPESEEDSDDEDAFEELDESSEESEEENKDLAKDSKKILSYKRLWSSLSQNDEEEEESYESDNEDVSKKKVQDKKKIKKDTSTPAPGKINGPTTQLKSAEIIDLEEDDVSASMNSSIGRTPMPKKKTPIVNQTNKSAQNMTPKKVNFAEASEESSDEDSGVKSSSLSVSPITAKTVDTSSSLSPSKKKKKKKKKAKDALNISNVSNDGANKSTKTGLSSATYNKKLSGGLEYEDIRAGNGPIAKKGKVVHVYYTGMLENNKVFDSREVGNKPFSFKLGSQQVISGWEIGIEGMKVGGKRRLKVPPNLGYENKRMGPIPPNSTLYFNIELKAVS